LVELVGSCYGQNIMRFFDADYNLDQLNEEFRLFEALLGAAPEQIKVFWPPERVWDTRSMAPLLRDAKLLNGGYRYVVLDDRTLLSPRDPDLPRSEYDKESRWTPELYQTYEIDDGLGLIALPIGIRLRHSIPPKRRRDWQRVQAELDALLVHAANSGETNVLALYADDMEKVTGVWNADGPQHYARFVRWLSGNPWIQPVKLSDWTASNPPAGRRQIEVGTFSELAREFNAGEGYEKWFHSTEWAPYRRYFETTKQRVQEARTRAAEPGLIALAEKQLLVSNWETAWHTPATGAHGDPEGAGQPSPWARALTSHCRHALVTADAAWWFMDRNRRACAVIRDVDLDEEPDLVFKNDRFYALVSPRWGGRVVSMFYLGESRAAMVVGNPCDDWNFLEDLNRFMEKPRNHPGAFADVGFENDRYSCEIMEQGDQAVIRLVNLESDSPALGLEKTFTFDARQPVLTVRYHLPLTLDRISIDCALSPDYLTLLRRGSEVMTMINGKVRGFSTQGLKIVVEPAVDAHWDKPEQEWIGHARTVRMTSAAREFEVNLRISE
jgi:hypothetical protein